MNILSLNKGFARNKEIKKRNFLLLVLEDWKCNTETCQGLNSADDLQKFRKKNICLIHFFISIKKMYTQIPGHGFGTQNTCRINTQEHALHHITTKKYITTRYSKFCKVDKMSKENFI